MATSVQSQEKEQKDNEAYSRNFARIPNMLFVSFQYLSKEEKFLYCTLKSIYWDSKPRYVSLRELSGMTGYSRSALGHMLPRLHKCGLIHAEVRREKGNDGQEKGNPKYNIAILDIWELNREYYASSPARHDALDPSRNLLVHEKSQELVREKGQACPPNKPSLSTKKDKVGLFGGQTQDVSKPVEPAKGTPKERENSKEKKDRETTVPTSPESSLSPSSEETLLSSLSESQADFWERWVAVSGCSYESLNETAQTHVGVLAEKIRSTSELQALYQFAYERIAALASAKKTKPIPPRLGNLVAAYPEWHQTQALKRQEREKQQKQRGHVSGTGTVPNWTQQRIAGKATEPSISVPETTQESTASRPARLSFAETRERLRKRVRKPEETTEEANV